MNPSPGLPASDRFRQYLKNLGRDIEPGSGLFSPDTVFWRVSRDEAIEAAMRVCSVHDRVHGQVIGATPAGRVKIPPYPYVA